MTDSKSGDHDDAVTHSDVTTDRAERLSPQECHETVDPETREQVLDEYTHRCQVCGRYGPEEGGLATLHVHHIERDPDGMGEHDLANLTLLCRLCHSWFHQQSTAADAPVEITKADQTVLLAQDIEILQYLAENGPARTGDIRAGLWSDHSVSAVRERLWVLMGLDNLVADRDRQIVDKDVETGEWGLTEQVENSARGHIPDDPGLLVQRVEDELVRQAIERDCTRTDITEVFDVSRRTTFNKHKRACAYDFPLDALDRGGRPADSASGEQSTISPEATSSDESTQQQLVTVADQETDAEEQHTSAEGFDSTGEVDAQSVDVDEELSEQPNQQSDDALVASVQQAIAALREIERAVDAS